MSTTRTRPSASSCGSSASSAASCALADLAGGDERRRLDRGVEADERNRADAAHEGKLRRRRRGESLPPMRRRACSRPSGRRPDHRAASNRCRGCRARPSRGRACPTSCSHAVAASYSTGRPRLIRSPVTAIWSGLWRKHIRDDEIERRAIVRVAALALPVEVAESALDIEMAQRDTRQPVKDAHQTRGQA